jgi:hypothetical protein
MLAASKEIAGRICIYNGKRPDMPGDHPDLRIPRRLTCKAGLEYHFIPQTAKIDDAFDRVYELNAPYPYRKVLPGIQAEEKYFQRKKVAATGNLLEISRLRHKIYNPEECSPSAEILLSITGLPESDFLKTALNDWLKKVDNTYNINIFDLFHWEQRDGRWLAGNCLVYSMAWKEVFFPYNCRQLFIDLLSVPGNYRMPPEYRLFKELINRMWPAMLSEPINPRFKASIISRVAKKLRRMV